MDRETSLAILHQVQTERAKVAEHPFAAAYKDMDAQRLRSDALLDVRNLALAALGVGVGARGLAGLYNVMKRSFRGAPQRSGPALLPLPYPVEPDPALDEEVEQRRRLKAASFMEWFRGDQATSKSGIPWYGPAMLFTGLGALGLGWKGTDMLLDRLRRRQTEEEVEKARGEFRKALLQQYSRPPQKIAAWQDSLDRTYDMLQSLLLKLPDKQAQLADWAGKATNVYGMVGGLGALITGMLVYDRARKRSRRAVLEKALQRRERRKFMQQPTEIYAVPEPVPA